MVYPGCVGWVYTREGYLPTMVPRRAYIQSVYLSIPQGVTGCIPLIPQGVHAPHTSGCTCASYLRVCTTRSVPQGVYYPLSTSGYTSLPYIPQGILASRTYLRVVHVPVLYFRVVYVPVLYLRVYKACSHTSGCTRPVPISQGVLFPQVYASQTGYYRGVDASLSLPVSLLVGS